MRVLGLSLALLLFSLPARGAVEDDWQYIVSLDAGPKKKPASREEALLLARNHLLIQRKAIEQFLTRYPQSDHAFDAKLKLARILAAEGKMDNDPRRVDEAFRLFEILESTPGLPSERSADVGFARASLTMQSQEATSERENRSFEQQKTLSRNILETGGDLGCWWRLRPSATMFRIKSGKCSKRRGVSPPRNR
jgi:hypothetical protein